MLLVDASVWPLALRRDGSTAEPQVLLLGEALAGADAVVTTGLVLTLLKTDPDFSHAVRHVPFSLWRP